MSILIIKEKFDASHKLCDYEGICSNLHGHTYKVEIYVKITNMNPNCGPNANISMDFGKLNKIIKNCLPDHKHLNDILCDNPTCEIIAHWLFNKLKSEQLQVEKLKLWETDKYGVEITGEKV